MKQMIGFLLVGLCVMSASLVEVRGAAPVRITIDPAKKRQEFQGLGCGAIFYEGHLTSLAARGKNDQQRQLYDDMFAKVPTRYLQLMIRHDHEPKNDNEDPWTQAFDPANFKYCEHTLAIAKAAKERRPDLQFVATIYTPPPWMKTNGAEGGGGKAKATLKPGLELEFAEYAWAFLAHMARNGVPMQYLSIANEPDWEHDQPGCFFTPDAYADLMKVVGEYLEKMAAKVPDVPRVKLVGPNTLSAPGAAKSYLPAMQRKAGKFLEVIASHDYDQRGDRWGDLQKLGRGKPVWVTEWCSREPDESPGQIKAATEYARAMNDAFGGGANVWMAYDWAYPPRKGGEALIHVDWGNGYTLKKPYWIFRQWAEPLVPGMRVVEVGNTPAEVKAAAFVSADGKTIVVHVVNLSEAESALVMNPAGAFATVAAAARTRTSATEDAAALPALNRGAGGFSDSLPGRSLTTYRLTAK
jgi:O-glycosyl hydrolase